MSKHKKSSRSTRSKDRRKEKGPKGASPTPPSGKQWASFLLSLCVWNRELVVWCALVVTGSEVFCE